FALIVLVVADRRFVDLEMVEQLARLPRIFAGDHRGFAKHAHGAIGDVFQVADRRGDQVQRARHDLEYSGTDAFPHSTCANLNWKLYARAGTNSPSGSGPAKIRRYCSPTPPDFTGAAGIRSFSTSPITVVWRSTRVDTAGAPNPSRLIS